MLHIAYVWAYTGFMVATNITQFRKELFHMADQALHGDKVEFLYKGVVFQVIPNNKPKSKLDKLIGQPVVAPGCDLAQAGKELLAGMEAEWLKDWSEI